MTLPAVSGSTFDAEVLGSELPVAVDFGADWCAPCRAVRPVLAELADRYQGRLRIVTVDTEAEHELTGRYGIVSIPTLYVFHSGELLRAIPGARTKLEYAAEFDAALAEAATL
ncbi:thioredoxin domain-containing protein [Cellulomonas sp. NPDC089187]|uniref:thioredoxin family protein n=1 Tax=Cellulomonas sp. NPDC089187 TaxID=3154970 RepID=UPI00343FD905